MKSWSTRPQALALCLLAVVAISIAVHSVAGQPTFVPVSGGRSPTSTRVFNVTTIDSAAASLEDSASSSESSSGSEGDDSSSLDGLDGLNDSDGSDSSSSDSGGSLDNDSWVSGSDGMEYKCSCKDIRKVSLMGASDYCLLPGAELSSKCGNVHLAEDGECPRTGAQPCSSMGHVLTNDSMCALDNKDDTYKCVASKDDLLIQKNGGKKSKKNAASSPSGSGASASLGNALPALSALQVLLVLVSLATGAAAAA